MKQDAADRVSRLRDRTPGGTAPEDRASALLRGLEFCEEPSEWQMAQIEEGIRARSSRRTRPSLTLCTVLTVLTLFVGVATVKAYELARRAGWLNQSHRVVLPSKGPGHQQALKRPGRAAATGQPAVAAPLDQAPIAKAPLAPVSAPAPEPKAVPSESPLRQARVSRHLAVVEAPAQASATAMERRDPLEPAPTVASAGPIAAGEARVPLAVPSQPLPPSVQSPAPSQEIHALDRAMVLLRRDRDAAAALTALDAYLDHYPHGILHREASLARLDALLLLQRTDEALAVLETLPLDSGRRSTELQVVRAEMRARTDCLRAEEDFSAALSHSPNATLLERILYGRGACRAKLGKASGAADDLRRYLERFPSGAHARWVRQWLSLRP